MIKANEQGSGASLFRKNHSFNSSIHRVNIPLSMHTLSGIMPHHKQVSKKKFKTPTISITDYEALIRVRKSFIHLNIKHLMPQLVQISKLKIYFQTYYLMTHPRLSFYLQKEIR